MKNMENIAVRRMPPASWLMESLLVSMFCFPPLGIAALLNSVKIRETYAVGNDSEAYALSARAARFVRVGFWIGVVLAAFFLTANLIMLYNNDILLF